MIFGLFGRKKTNRRIVDDLYATLTEAARHPRFYEDMGAPDTVMGRFELVAIHMVLFLRSSAKGSPALKDLTQDIVDAFFQDLDHSIREIGIGDVGVPKRMKKLARMFYGRLEAYGSALDADDRAALAAALARNIHPSRGDGPIPPGMTALADHLFALSAYFDTIAEEAILTARMVVPPPGKTSEESCP